MEPPAPFVWEQRDATKLRCTECGEIVDAVVCDLHMMTEHPDYENEGGKR